MSTQTSKNRILLIKEVNETKKIDMGVEKFFIASSTYSNVKEIEYEVKDNIATTASFKSFAESAEIIERDATKIVRLRPFEINRQVTFSEVELYERRFGSNPYESVKNPLLYATKEAVYDYCHAGALMRRKKMIAGFMQKLKFTKAIDLIDADFNIDTTKKVIVKTSDLWNQAGAPIIDDLVKLKDATDKKATVVVINANTYANMITNGDLRTSDNTSTGEVRNFILNEKATPGEEFYNIGKITDPRLMLDVYIWDSNDKETYLEDGYVFAGRNKSMQAIFGGISTRLAPNTQSIVLPVEWTIERDFGNNPTVDALVYKSAPMYAPMGIKSYATMKTY